MRRAASRGMFANMLAKEMAALWCTPLPYITGAVFQATLAVLYLSELRARGQAALAPLVPLGGFLLLIIVAVLGARTVAEERRTGTLELLEAIPLRRPPLVLSKWAAVALTSLIVLAPAGGFAALLSAWAQPDSGPVLTGLVGLALLTVALSAISVAFSAATSQQSVAALLAVALGLALWFAHVEPGQVRTASLLGRFSLTERLRAFAGGALDAGDVVYFIALTMLALVVAIALLGRGAESRGRARAWLPVAIVAVLATVVLGRVDDAGWSADMTQDEALTLSSQTRGVLRAVDSRVKVTAVVSDDRGRSEAAALLARYRKLNRRLSFRVIRATDAPGEVRRLGVDGVLGGVAFESGAKIEHAADLSEQDLTAALARLVRDHAASVCVAIGHGEADPSASIGEGWQRAAAVLTSNGYRVRAVDLLREPGVPADCNALVLSAPTAPLGEAELAVAAYLRGGGAALVLADPIATVDLSGLLTPYGLSLRRGIVFEGDDAFRLRGDPVTPIIRRFQSGFPVVRRLPPVFFAGAQQVVASAATPEGVTAAVMAQTSDLSFLETVPADDGFDEQVDAPGPVGLLAAADASIADGALLRRSRVVVASDADWATNALIDQAGHGRLLVQALDWITLDESLVTVSPNVARLRVLDLTAARLRYARVLMAGLVPLLYLSAGLVVWALRRSR